MYHAVSFQKIEDKLKKTYRRISPKSSKNDQDNKFVTTDYVSPGSSWNTAASIPQQSKSKKLRKVVGILFADPSIPFAKNEVIPQLDYINLLSGEHFDIYCAGYNALVPPNEAPKDNQKALPEVDGNLWKFSTKAFIEFEESLEKMTSWKREDGCTLLLFTVIVTKDSITYDFENCLNWNLITMIQVEKSSTSVRKLLTDFTNAIKNGAGTWEASDEFGIQLLQDTIKDSILSLAPKLVSDKYKQAEHFAVKNYKKK